MKSIAVPPGCNFVKQISKRQIFLLYVGIPYVIHETSVISQYKDCLSGYKDFHRNRKYKVYVYGRC